MNKITMEKVLHFAGSLIGAIFLVAWNVAKVVVPVLVGMVLAQAEAVEDAEEEHRDNLDYTPHLRELSLRQEDSLYWYDD